MSGRPWVFCQIGAREHYVLAREFHRHGELAALVTDFWVPPGGLLHRIAGPTSRKFQDRYHEGLADATVINFNQSAVVRETVQRLVQRRRCGWQTIIWRNNWFQRKAANALEKAGILAARPVVFAYSYAARDIFARARKAGCLTVLGQIDPAIHEENIVADASRRHAAVAPAWQRAPEDYWQAWREECELADRIVVNSVWSRDGLIEAGVPANKLRVLPLAYEADAKPAPRSYPEKFTAERPLRILFLGTLTIRKGVAELLKVAEILKNEPVEFHFVGREELVFPSQTAANPSIVRHGPVPRSAVEEHYDRADLFILPTLSDGFALTQIEAQARGLPVIASRRCGDVVCDGTNGLLLSAPSSADIAEAIRHYLHQPAKLKLHSDASMHSAERFSPRNIYGALRDIAGEGRA